MPSMITVALTENQIRGLVEAANRADAEMVNPVLRRGANAGATKLEDALRIAEGGVLPFVRRTRPRGVGA